MRAVRRFKSAVIVQISVARSNILAGVQIVTGKINEVSTVVVGVQKIERIHGYDQGHCRETHELAEHTSNLTKTKMLEAQTGKTNPMTD